MTSTETRPSTTFDAPAGIAVRGTLVVVPGRGESPEIYERFGRRLAADAYRVHVLTAPTDDADRTAADLRDALAATDGGAPRVLVGSDGGAAFVARLVADGELPDADALVLAGLPTHVSTPAVDWDDELEARTACGTHRARITAGGVQRSALFAELPTTWVDPTVAPGITVPVLGLHGDADPVSPVADARRWYAAVPHAELVTIAGGRHDALNDQTHRTAAAVLVLFLERLRLDRGLTAIATVDPREHVEPLEAAGEHRP